MRRKDREITDIAEIEEIINSAICCRIGLVDNDEPYVVPVNFGYEKKALFFHGAMDGRKVEVIRKNNKICFEIDTDMEIIKGEEPCRWAMKYRSVMGTGSAHILDNDDEKNHGLSVIMRHYADDDFIFSKPALDSVMVVKIDIASISGKKSGYQTEG